MVKHSRRHKRSHKRNYKGGSNYTSASSYGNYVNGSGNSQFTRTFDQNGPYANRLGTSYVGAQGQLSKVPNVATNENLSLIQSAGKSRKKRGGLIGEVINQAVVPFGLLSLQQNFKKKKFAKKTRRYK